MLPLLVLAVLPSTLFGAVALLSLAVVGALVLLIATLDLARPVRRQSKSGQTCAAYFGSLARTLIPVLALALILVNVCSRPYLRWSEQRWLARDTLLAIDTGGGFTAVESRVTQRLQSEIAQAAAGLPR
jgi:hypothetical protein